MEQKKFTPSICRKVLRLIQGETLPSSLFPRWFADELKEEGLLSVITHGSRNSYRLLDVEASIRYVKNKYTGGAELSRWIELTDGHNPDLDRSVLVNETGDSKLVRVRTFRGFLVNCCEPLEVTMGEKSFTLSPLEGMAFFCAGTGEIPHTLRCACGGCGERRQLSSASPSATFVQGPESTPCVTLSSVG